MTDIVSQLEASLKSDRSDANLRQWATYIITQRISLETLHPLLHAEKTVSMRFTWLVGGLCEQAPETVFPSVTYFYRKRNEIAFPNYDRSLAKMFWLAGIPEAIEGDAINDLFMWLTDARITVSTKKYSMFALLNLTGKYPELKNELRISLEDQLDKNTANFNKRIKEVLRKL